nr:uncharacterized protein LOC109166481 [Ipomoea batatas]
MASFSDNSGSSLPSLPFSGVLPLLTTTQQRPSDDSGNHEQPWVESSPSAAILTETMTKVDHIRLSSPRRTLEAGSGNGDLLSVLLLSSTVTGERPKQSEARKWRGGAEQRATSADLSLPLGSGRAPEELLEKIATNGTTWYSERSSQRLVGGFHDVDQISALSAKVDNMASMVQKIAQITLQNQNMSYASTIPILSRQIMMCELCGGEHNMGECLNDDMGSKSSMEHVDLVGYGRQQQSFQPQGAYNPNASRNHPGFSWSNPMGAANPQNFGNRGPPPGFQGQQNFRGGEQQQSMPNLGFQAPTTQPRQSSENSPPPNWEAMMEMMFKSQMKSDERLRQLTEKLDQLGAHNKMLERQIANQASTSSTQVTGKLPAYPENPREHVNAIITRSGKELEEPSLQIHKPMPKERSNGEIEEVEKEEATPPTYIPNQQVHNKDDGVKPERKYVPPLPFPQKFQCQAKEKEKVAFNVFDEPKSPFVEKCYRVDVVSNKRLEKGEEFDALDERYFDEHKRFKKILHEEVGDVAILEKESKVRKIEESEFLFEDGGQALQNKVKDWANNSKLKALIEEYPMAFKTFVERFIEARNWKCLENHPG